MKSSLTGDTSRIARVTTHLRGRTFLSPTRLAHFGVIAVLAFATFGYVAVMQQRYSGLQKAHAVQNWGTAQYSAGGTWFALCKTYRNDPTYGPQWDVSVLLDRGTDPVRLVGKWGLAFYTVRYNGPGYAGGYYNTNFQKVQDQWMPGGNGWMMMTLPISGLLADGVRVVVGSDTTPYRPGADAWATPPAAGPSEAGIFIPGDSTVMPEC